MTRDQKIGLALGILLVGAVAAFFYRHETPAAAPLPELQTAAELEQQIAERPMAPYGDSHSQPPGASQLPTTVKPVDAAKSSGLVPDPIALEATPTTDPSTQLASSTTVKPPTPGDASTAIQREKFHVVERGDTLSSIAAKHLGSAARFQEIYEANRDRLRDANDLRIGQELRIPVPLAKLPGDPASAATTPAIEPQPPAPKFAPYPGSVGAPRTATPNGGRRLSQVPPDDLIIRR